MDDGPALVLPTVHRVVDCLLQRVQHGGDRLVVWSRKPDDAPREYVHHQLAAHELALGADAREVCDRPLVEAGRGVPARNQIECGRSAAISDVVVRARRPVATPRKPCQP